MPSPPTSSDEALCARLRDLALVELDALIDTPGLTARFAEDLADALTAARGRLATLRGQLGGVDALAVLDATAGQRASEAGAANALRVRDRLHAQAEAARGLARLAELVAPLVPKLVAADRRR